MMVLTFKSQMTHSIHFLEENIKVILPDTAKTIKIKTARESFIFSTAMKLFAINYFIQISGHP